MCCGSPSKPKRKRFEIVRADPLYAELIEYAMGETMLLK